MGLFQQKIDPRCVYCTKSTKSILLNESQILCEIKGIMSPESHCRNFSYDPLKRVPPRPLSMDFKQLNDEDFSI